MLFFNMIAIAIAFVEITAASWASPFVFFAFNGVAAAITFCGNKFRFKTFGHRIIPHLARSSANGDPLLHAGQYDLE